MMPPANAIIEQENALLFRGDSEVFWRNFRPSLGSHFRCHRATQSVSVIPMQTIRGGQRVRNGHRATDNERDSFSTRQKEKKNGS
ncbi:MAG: hypothetical protein ACI93T_003198 [Porticoccaceae bacterium]|jgi:hypothetical protein